MKLIPDAAAQTEPPPPTGADAAPAPTPAPPAPASPAAQAPPAKGAPTTDAVQQPANSIEPPTVSDLLATAVPVLVIVAIMYLIVLRPQQRVEREKQNQLRNVRRGDVVATAGGLIGKVTKAIDDKEFELEIAPNVRIRMLLSAITEIRSRGEPVKPPAAAKS